MFEGFNTGHNTDRNRSEAATNKELVDTALINKVMGRYDIANPGAVLPELTHELRAMREMGDADDVIEAELDRKLKGLFTPKA